MDRLALLAVTAGVLLVRAYATPRPIGPLRPWDCLLPRVQVNGAPLRVTLYATDPAQLVRDYGARVLG